MRLRTLLRLVSAVFFLTPTAALADPAPPAGTCEVIPPFTPSFEPEIEWEWTDSTTLPSHVQVMMTPVVIELNGDGVPDVAFNAFAGSNYNSNGVLRAISGADGSELWTVTDAAYRVRGASSIAAGDIDGDGLAELCTVAESGSTILCFENDGAFKLSIASSPNSWGGVAFADLEGDGAVEIINGNRVYAADGSLLWAGADGMGGHAGTGPLSFAADIDGDGAQEVVNDRAIYRADGSMKCANTAIGHGLAGVGDFDDDALGEVVVVWGGNVSLLDDDCALLWTTAIPGGGTGGAPNIADFDNDGAPEVGVAGRASYVVFETDGSVKWSTPVQDFSSNRTGSSTFDFEGDGVAEVVYADERFLRIYDGETGAVRFQVAHSSGTTYENPVVVDVDADGNAEIVIASNNYAFPGVHGIRVFRDANDGWVNTRGVWNQHAYSVTNVDEDGSIPAHPTSNWLVDGLNAFRSNSQGTATVTPFAAPDLVVAGLTAECVPASYDSEVTAHVHNQGQAPASAGVQVAFYLGDPEADGVLWWVESVPTIIPALGSVDVTFTATAPGEAVTVFAVVDDDGTGVGSETECREDNNGRAVGADLLCTPNDPPIAVCEDVVVSADAMCTGYGSIDGGSYDPDGDPLSLEQSPAGPYGLGWTAAELEVCDDSDACDVCEALVTVVDDTPPTVACNAAATITPADTPTSFTATASDNCGVTVAIDGYDCFKLKKDGTPQSKLDSCEVSVDGATLTVTDSGGVGTHITWTATAVDAGGNSVTVDCETVVDRPGNGGCNQGVGNGAEGCDPGNSNQGDDANSNDENGGVPGAPGKGKSQKK